MLSANKSTLAPVQYLCEHRILAFVTLSEVEVWQMLSSLKVLLIRASTALSLTICTNTEQEPKYFYQSYI